MIETNGLGLNAVVVVESRREINGKITDEDMLRHYLAGDASHRGRPHDPRTGDRETPCTWSWTFATMNAAS